MTEAERIRFDALRNAIYHTARRGFFDTMNRALSFLVVISGAGAVSNVLGGSSVYLAGVAAIAGLAQLVFDFNGKARVHEHLQRRFYELIAEITECREPDDDCRARWAATINRLYADEPPPMRAVDAIAYNSAIDATDHEKKGRIPVRWWHILFGHFWPFSDSAFASDGSASPSV